MAASVPTNRLAILALQLCLVLGACSSAYAACTGPVPAVCQAFSTSTTYYEESISGYTRPSDLEAEMLINKIDALSFCDSCKKVVKQNYCATIYPACGANGPIYPNVDTCNSAISQSCSRGLLSLELEIAFDTLLEERLGSVGFVGKSPCNQFLSPFQNYPTRTDHTQILPVSGCTCSTPTASEYNICGAYLDYPVWDVLNMNSTFMDYQAGLVMDRIVPLFNNPNLGGYCTSCADTLKRTVCQALFPKCADPTTPVVPSCKSECTTLMSTCRVNDLADSSFRAVVDSLDLGLDFAKVTTIQEFCDSSTFSSNTATCADHSLFSPTPPRCDCEPAPQFLESDYCYPFVTYPVIRPIALNADRINIQVNAFMAKYQKLEFKTCPECFLSLKETICRMAFPKCTTTGQQVMCNSSCSVMANDHCRISAWKADCETFVQGLPTSGSCDLPSPRTPCACGKADFTGLAATSQICAPYVKYDVPYGWSGTATSIYADEAAGRLGQFALIRSFLCPTCSEAVTRQMCESIFPHCDATEHIQLKANVSCTAHMATCAIPALTIGYCDIVNAITPQLYGAAFYDSSDSASTATCVYCGRRADVGLCTQYADWDTYIVNLPGVDQSKFLNLAEFVLPTINFPNCTDCTFQIRRTMCSVFVLPCNTSIVNKLVSSLLQLPPGTTSIPTEAALTATTRPCYSTCDKVLKQCLTTMPPNPKNFFFACDAKLPGLPPNVELYDKSGDCVAHPYPPLPPANCPIWGAPALSSPGSSNSTTAGISSGAIAAAVIIPVVSGIAGAAVFALLLIRKKWIFKVHHVDLDALNAEMDAQNPQPARTTTLEAADWSRAKKPRVVRNLK